MNVSTMNQLPQNGALFMKPREISDYWGGCERRKKSPVMCKAIFLAEKGKFQICQTLCVHNFDRNSK